MLEYVHKWSWHSLFNPIPHEGGPYGPHTEELPDNSELARAGGPSFGDF